jgi:hypothetical protein
MVVCLALTGASLGPWWSKPNWGHHCQGVGACHLTTEIRQVHLVADTLFSVIWKNVLGQPRT